MTTPTVLFCPSCDKPFTNDRQCSRHIRYCKTKVCRRPKSCRACNIAKTKCSFETPCRRCGRKGLECIYENVKHGRGHKTSSGSPEIDPLLIEEGEHVADVVTLVRTSREDQISVFSDTSYSPTPNHQKASYPRFAILQMSPLNDYQLDGTLDWNDFLVNPTDDTLLPHNKQNNVLSNWCAWTRHGLSLAVVADQRHDQTIGSLRTRAYNRDRPLAQHSANVVIQALRAFPTMMLRKETLPWFIHAKSGLMFPQTADYEETLPEPLSTCMAVTQIWASKSRETRSFLWKSIKTQQQSLSLACGTSAAEVHVATQAQMVYLVMCIIEPATDNEGLGQGILATLFDLYMYSKATFGFGQFDIFIPQRPSWEDWILAESQRRLALLWLLIGCIVCVKLSIPCDTSQSYRVLPLPCSKRLWEANTRELWEEEYDAGRTAQAHGLVTLGDLLDVQKAEYSETNARKMDVWNAGVDTLGGLINIVGTML